MKGRIALLLISLAAALIGIAVGLPDKRRAPRVPAPVQAEAGEPEDAPGPSGGNPGTRPLDAGLRRAYCLDAHAVTCGTEWPSLDPTGKVRSDMSGEIRALRLMRRIVQENPSWTSGQVHEALAREIYTDTRRRRAEDGFLWVMAALRALIERQPDTVFSAAEKKRILRHLKRITLELPPPASVYEDAADLLTKNTVYYERTPKGKLRLRMGGAYLLNTTSWYNVVFTLAHELAHAIDPCEARHAGILPRAYEDLITCFVRAGWVDPRRTECGPDEQVSEVFADWIAAEIAGAAIAEKGRDYAPNDRASAAINATRDLCAQPAAVDSLSFQLHQRPEVRIGTVMGGNPSVRRALGCESPVNPQYCRWSAPARRGGREEKRR